MLLLAIDPGNVESAYVVIEHDGDEIKRVRECGKHPNYDILWIIDNVLNAGCEEMAYEQVSNYGMIVGSTVFDTCFWAGRFVERANEYFRVKPIFRREEKMYLCGRVAAKDKDIIAALVDRFAPGQPNRGKGTKSKPGFFYGFHDDIWQAMAVGVTYFDKYVKGVKL